MTYFGFVIFISLAHFINGQNSYIAAVYEHAPSTEDLPINTMFKNVQSYRSAVEEARKKGVNIIVFPEYGLTTLAAAENPEGYALNLTDTYPYNDQVLRELSDLAGEHNMYMIVNLLEKEVNKNGQTIFYNTNLVFDKRGSIVAKYRKINLYNESKLTPGKEIVTFTADFGVTFGVFTCSDILFQNPSRNILSNTRVTDIVYPSAWYSTMPFYTSLSVQNGYSTATGVNLLAANYGNPKDGNGGSGIFLANGDIAEVYIGGSRSSKLIIQRVNKIDERKNKDSCPKVVPFGFGGTGLVKPNISDYITKKDFESENFKFKDVDLSKEQQSIEVCHKDFCCTFNITIENSNNNEVYKVMAFDGFSEMDDVDQHIRVCSLLICKNKMADSCGERINGTTRFNRISISGDLPFSNTTFYQPVTLDYDLMPITKTAYCASSEDDVTASVQLFTQAAQEKILVFGIYGRVNAAMTHQIGYFLLVALFAIKMIIS